MKLASVDDKKFQGWIDNGQLVKCHAFPHTAYPHPPEGLFDKNDKPSGVCYWDIDRTAEVSPSALAVHSATRVLVRVKNLRQNEIITPAVVFAKIVPPSPGNDILKNAVNPLQAITPTPVVHNKEEQQALDKKNKDDKKAWDKSVTDACTPGSATFDADKCQSLLGQQITSIQASVNHVNAALACLESYQVAVPYDPPEPITPKPEIPAFSCTASHLINPNPQEDSFASQKTLLMNTIASVAPMVTSLVITFTKFDTFISKDTTTYAAEILLDAQIKGAINTIQSSQTSLQQSYTVLLSIPDKVPNKIYYFDVPHLTTATATITGVEIVSKTNSTIATWTTSSTSYSFVFSSGLGFSNLVNRTYANTPQLQNGKPVLNGSGSVISIVTETDNNLSVIVPQVMGSVLLPWQRRFSTSCSFGCSFLLSGGIGANLTTKTADFDTGISLRLADVLITPAVHFGRETRLSDGIYVGEQIGANAPNSLPTHTTWVRKFGIVFTYAIPLP